MNLSEEAIEEFRTLRLSNIISMIENIHTIAQQTNCKQEDILLLRHELLEKKRNLESKLASRTPLDEEEESLLKMVEEVQHDDT